MTKYPMKTRLSAKCFAECDVENPRGGVRHIIDGKGQY